MKKQPVNKSAAKPGAGQKTASKQKAFFMLVIVAVLAISGVTATALLKKPTTKNNKVETNLSVQLNGAGDLVIPINGISETASFYPVTIDGTKLEVLAVKAPDGTIRTAFNTCQVCYDSGRGYYKQSGDVLVCQNCGNRFKMSAVEVSKGGCNPVPIFAENKMIDDTTITISGVYLIQATQIFENWKVN